MDFKRITHFVAVAEAGSMTEAARRLHIVQPALSHSIKRLEEEIGMPLFERSRRGMTLSEAGKVFIRSAYGILNQFTRAKEDVAALGTNPSGLVSVAMTASVLNVLSVPIGHLLRANHPEIDLNLEEGLASNIRTGLEAGSYDFVISSGLNPEDGLHFEALMLEDLYFIAPCAEDAGEAGKIAFRQIQGRPLVVPKDQQAIADNLNEVSIREKVALETSNLSAALHPTLLLVEAGLGCSVVPWSAIHDRVRAKRLSAYRIHSPRLTSAVSLVHALNKPPSQASIAVMRLVRQAVHEAHELGQWRGARPMAEAD